MTTQEPPNLRGADTCTLCKHGREGFDRDATCSKYDCWTGWDMICDDFERKEE